MQLCKTVLFQQWLLTTFGFRGLVHSLNAVRKWETTLSLLKETGDGASGLDELFVYLKQP